ncbi:PREDICTED: uncharacterized protein LOC109584483 isoform X1 [Amphimedon queenslandica]|uniref:Biogenesis of lysosome-related organelles complex 1 subunit 5 n=1 Tax=Amphimedon queenslandica TaxID=400682 RepID=A0AAN0JFR2_AMPQE|nr:PREDICTED: uncharacterized protein LOC109584483 isoform X1 [Amphimedon queenslandica]|eukprot:XP_019855794.1 PREDICTED: uncharacterized protein LOC109584483 isoform X1 [Amphimedon queenslandica]
MNFDSRRPLYNTEIDHFLDKLKEVFVDDCQKYFQKIKPMIAESYLKQHREIVEKNIADVEQHYFEQRKAMDAQVQEWRKQAKYNKEMVQCHSDLIDNLKKQKVHLLSLANQFGIYLFPKHLQDE